MTGDGPHMEFGWQGDGGLGEKLIAQVLAGVKTATCGFKDAYSAEELAEAYANVGRVIPVVDAEGRERCRIRILEVFETPFGDPDPRLVRGEGDGDDVEAFRRDHRVAWEATMDGRPLTDGSLLVVELFELAEAER